MDRKMQDNIDILHKAGIANPLRLRNIIQQTIDFLELDLKGLTVLTEAASGPYVVTPIIAAMAGAERIYALSRNSAYASVEEVKRQTEALRKVCEGSDCMTIFSDRPSFVFAQADIVTNLGFVRPLDREAIELMKPTAIIPLMCEDWEFREGDVDLDACREKGIKVFGTNEDFPGLEVFSYSAWLCIKLLHDAQIEIHKSKIVIVSSDKFGTVIETLLRRTGIDVSLIPAVDMQVVKGSDVLVVADYTRDDEIIGPNGDVSAEDIYLSAPHLTIVQFAGVVDVKSITSSGISLYPGIDLPARRMARTLAGLGPRPVVELHAAGLKVGEYLIKKNNLNIVNDIYKTLCQPLTI